MILLHTALQAEANPLIDHFHLRFNNDFSKIRQYESDDIRLIISGTGKIKTAASVGAVLGSFFSKEITCAINFGICGSHKHEIGSIFRINQLKDFSTQRLYYPECEPFASIQTSGILCVENPLSEKQALTDRFPLVDMESVGFFEASSLFLPQHSIEILKIVSDSLEPQSFTKQHIEHLISLLVNDLDQLISFKKNIPVKTKDVPESISNWIKLCSESLRLSVTQQRMLTQAVKFYRLRNTSDLPEFNLSETPISPKQRLARLEELLVLLYS